MPLGGMHAPAEAPQFANAVLEANTDVHFKKMEELCSTHSMLEADECMASDMLVLPALTLPAAAVLVPWLLAACGDIESNPGPGETVSGIKGETLCINQLPLSNTYTTW
jgi:hypothetical protein